MNAILKSTESQTEMRFHPASEIFPLMNEVDLGKLAEDIKQHGLRIAIVLHPDGSILDGRNRYRACRLAAVEPRFETWDGRGLAVDYAWSLNDTRRHLDGGARAIAAGRYAIAREAEARFRQGMRTDLTSAPIGDEVQYGRSVEHAAKKFEIGKGTVERAVAVLKNAAPELVAAVESGDAAVSSAAEILILPVEEQRAHVAAGTVSEAAREVREQKQEERVQAKIAGITPQEMRQMPKPKSPQPQAPLALATPTVRKFYTMDDWQKLSQKEREEVISFALGQTDSFAFSRQDDPKEDEEEGKESMGNIEWARWSWNPVTGCLHNCPYCYARDITERWPQAFPMGFMPTFHPGRLAGPKNTKVPAGAKDNMALKNVFSNSMSDLYGRWVPNEWIEATLQVMRASPQWNYLMLTKFPKKAAEFTYSPNCWIGTSIDLQARVKAAEDAFERIESGVNWLSIEPMLEPLKFTRPHLFKWVVIGGASRSTKTPAWTPPFEWVVRVASQFLEHGAKVYLKTNGRPREYPGVITPESAPEAFRYLGKAKD